MRGLNYTWDFLWMLKPGGSFTVIKSLMYKVQLIRVNVCKLLRFILKFLWFISDRMIEYSTCTSALH